MSSSSRPTVLITGCTPGGIGHSLALSFAARNHTVFATSRPSSLNQLSSLQSQYPGQIIPVPLDVTFESSIQSCLSTLRTHLAGRGLDYLVNNAGVSYIMPALDVDLDTAKSVFDTNFFAIVRLTQALGPLIVEAQGTIVMIGSLGAIMPYVFGSVYNASKAALLAYSNTLRVEMAPLGVKVITVVAGGVKSRLGRTHRTLPDGSFYKEMEDDFVRRQGYSHSVGVPNEEFADRVVMQVIKGGGDWPWRWLLRDARKRWVWEGYGRWLIYSISGSWTWSGIFDWIFTTRFGLNKMRRTDAAVRTSKKD